MMKRYFIDSMLLKLEYLEKLDETDNFVEYFYPCIDAYLPRKDKEKWFLQKIKHWTRQCNYTPRVNFNKQELDLIKSSNKYEGRFSMVFPPFIKSFQGNNFISNNGSIEKGAILSNGQVGFFAAKETIVKYLEVERSLRELFPDLSSENKDFHVLSTVISCDSKSMLIRTFEGTKGEKYEQGVKNQGGLMNECGNKYFLTLDCHGLFGEEKGIKRIEREFKNLKIYNAKNINQLIIKLSEN
jgi:hypothetical protein